jgi:glucokinase
MVRMKNTQRKAVLAADIGGTSIKLAVVDGGRLLARAEIKSSPSDGLAAALPQIMRGWENLKRNLSIDDSGIKALGVAIPAIIAPEGGKIWAVPAGKFPDAVGLDLGRWFSGRYKNKSAYWCNDAHAALAGERHYGAARHAANVVMITLGTGVGTAVLLNGRHLHGSHGLAGNAGGHVTLDCHGKACPCGNIGCVETMASTWTLSERAKSSRRFRHSLLAQMGSIDYEAVLAAADAGDWLATELRDSSFRAWAMVAASEIHHYDPDLLLLGGKIGANCRPLLKAIDDYVQRHTWVRWKLAIKPAELGSDAGLLGVAYLAARESRGKLP